MATGTSCNKETYNKLFTEMVGKHWNRGPERLWDPPSPEIVRTHPDWTCFELGIGIEMPQVPFNLNYSYQTICLH